MTLDVTLDLLAEVGRLKALISSAECEGTSSSTLVESACPWCLGGSFLDRSKDCWMSKHEPDCAAFSAPGVVR